jgi:hypothetical protein
VVSAAKEIRTSSSTKLKSATGQPVKEPRAKPHTETRTDQCRPEHTLSHRQMKQAGKSVGRTSVCFDSKWERKIPPGPHEKIQPDRCALARWKNQGERLGFEEPERELETLRSGRKNSGRRKPTMKKPSGLTMPRSAAGANRNLG